MAYVYLHRRADTTVPFYVGISNGDYSRKTNINKRSDLYKKVYKKHGRTVEIIADSISYNDAKELEMLIISTLGKIIDKSGPLVNITDGGDGTLGYNHTEESKTLMSVNRRGKYSGENNHYYGKHHSEEVKAIMRVKAEGRVVCEKARLKSYDVNSIPIILLKDGRDPIHFKSAADAGIFLNLKATNISRAAKSNTRKCRGYKVNYMDYEAYI